MAVGFSQTWIRSTLTAMLILFAASFLAATVLPFYSEVVLVGLLTQGYNANMLIVVATIGNTLGAVVNWALGKYLLRFKERKWFYFNDTQLSAMQSSFNRYGKWSLLLAWLPVGGDALTFIAGVMRIKLWIFLPLVGIGKLARYLVVVYSAQLVQKFGFPYLPWQV